MKTKLRARLSLNSIYVVTASVSIVLIVAAVIAFHLVEPPMAMAAAAGDFRAKVSGNWNVNGTWEYFDGTSWINAVSTPTSASGEITIQSPYTVSVSANVIADQVIVASGGTISINAGRTLTIANGAGTDLVVNGTVTINGSLVNNTGTDMTMAGTVTLKNGGTHTIAGTVVINSGGYYDRQDASLTTTVGIFTINSGGTYAHNVNGGNIIVATWNSGSDCIVNGVTTLKPGNLNQTFYNFTWNCASQSVMQNLAGRLLAISGNLTWVSTGTSYVRWGENDNYTMNISGNYYHQGGTVVMNGHSQNCYINIAGNLVVTGGLICGNDSTMYSGDGSPEVYITGNVNFSAGTINYSQFTGGGAMKGHMDFYLYGDWIQTGGTATVTSSAGGNGRLYFNKTGTQYFNKSAGTIDQEINFTIKSGSVTDMMTYAATGTGTFVVNSGGELRMGSPNGITSSGASGNVQVTGIRTFSAGGFYTYNGLSTQVTGNGLPSTIAKLTINNASGVALTQNTSVSNTFYMTSGTLTTPSDTIIVGTSTAVLGALSYTSGMVDGYLKRWFAATTVSNVLFPMGTGGLLQSINLSFTTAPSTAGSVTAHFVALDPGKNGFNIVDAGDTLVNIGYGLWSTAMGNNLVGGTFNLDITATALSTVNNVANLHLIYRTNSVAAWETHGTHVVGTGTNAIPIVHRTGMTLHGQYGVASGSANPLPVTLLYFNAKQNGSKVDLSWSTAVELNNDYFTIERSSDGKNFTDLFTKRGIGNSTVTNIYNDQDNVPLKGVNYYRLKQTDYNGLSKISEIKSIDFTATSTAEVNQFSVFPNPFYNGFKISFNVVKEAEATFMVVNSGGGIIAEEKFEATEGFNNFEYLLKSDLPVGVYFSYLIVGETKLSQKIIKQ